MSALTEREYYAECDSIARELVTEFGRNSDDLYDRLHETIDGHQWVIYTAYNIDICKISRNTDAYFDDFGPLEAKDFGDAVVKIAFWAFMRDVQECIADLDEDEVPDPPEEE